MNNSQLPVKCSAQNNIFHKLSSLDLCSIEIQCTLLTVFSAKIPKNDLREKTIAFTEICEKVKKLIAFYLYHYTVMINI